MLLCLGRRSRVAVVVVEIASRSVVVVVCVAATLILLIGCLIRGVAVGTRYDTMTARCCIDCILPSLCRLNLSLNLLVRQRVDLRRRHGRILSLQIVFDLANRRHMT